MNFLIRKLESCRDLRLLCGMMEGPVFINYTLAVWTVVMLLLVDGNYAKLTIYEDKCNETIFVGGTTVAGKLVYNHYPAVSENTCDILIKTEPGHSIGYAFKQTTAFREIFINKDSIFYACTTVSWSADGMVRFGCDKSNYTDMLYTTSGDTLTIRVRGDNFSYFKFELVFFTFHYSNCNSNEIRCYSIMGSLLDDYRPACVDQTLACDQAYKFCDTTSSSCTDIIADNFSFNLNASLIAAIVLLCIFLMCLYMI